MLYLSKSLGTQHAIRMQYKIEYKPTKIINYGILYSKKKVSNTYHNHYEETPLKAT